MRITKALFILTLFVLLSNSTFAQKNLKNLMPYRVGAKYGFADQNYNIVIAAKYNGVTPFYYGRALVSNDSGMGMIDEDGKVIIPHSKAVLKRRNNYILYQNHKSRKYTILDLNGNNIFQEVYNKIELGAEGFFIVTRTDGTVGLIDEKERMIIPFHKDVMIEYKAGGIHRRGEEYYTQYFRRTKTGAFYDKIGKFIKEMNPKHASSNRIYSSIKFEKPERFKNKPIWFPGAARNGYRIFQMTQRGDDAYILDPTGKVVCENCERILDCEKYFVKYVREKGYRIWRQNLVDWNGKLFFKKNYDRIYIVNGDEETCPNRFMVYDRKAKSHWLINEKGKKKSAKYTKLKKISPTMLLAEDGIGQKSFINLDGKILNTFANLKQQIPDIEKREIKNQNGIVVITGNSNKTHFIDDSGRLLYVKELPRKEGEFWEGDVVWVKGTDRIFRIDHNHKIEDGRITNHYFNKETYEEMVTINNVENLQLVKVEVKENNVFITGKGQPIKIEVGDNIWFYGNKKTYTVKKISESGLSYESRTSKVYPTHIGSGMYSKSLKIADVPIKIKRVEAMNYQARSEKFPIDERVSWIDNNGHTNIGVISQVPMVADSLMVVQFQNDGSKIYIPIATEKVKVAPMTELTLQDSIRLLTEEWTQINQLFGINSRDVGNVAVEEDHIWKWIKEKKNNSRVSFSHSLNISAGNYFGRDPKSSVEMSGNWSFRNGKIIVQLEGKGSITFGRGDTAKNKWKHELIFKVLKMSKDEIELLLEKKNSERLEKVE